MKVIYIDGYCNLCNGLVRYIFKRYPLKFMFGKFDSSIDSRYVIYLRDGLEYKAEDAIKMITKDMAGPYLFFILFMNLMPDRLIKYLYFWIASNRYKLFGKKKVCDIDALIPKSHLVDDFHT